MVSDVVVSVVSAVSDSAVCVVGVVEVSVLDSVMKEVGFVVAENVSLVAVVALVVEVVPLVEIVR